MGAPQPVLERPVHLSYPNVFERDGEMWMIPESGAAGTIDLYRARAFPGSWTLETTLVGGLFASDATLVERDGRWWMFATVRDGGGAYSDALWLWSAPDFRGPWKPHARNPVLIDIASARPAGAMFVRDGALYRPVQDCRAGYGAAMALARVDRARRRRLRADGRERDAARGGLAGAAAAHLQRRRGVRIHRRIGVRPALGGAAAAGSARDAARPSVSSASTPWRGRPAATAAASTSLR